jgi:hypothetical protein
VAPAAGGVCEFGVVADFHLVVHNHSPNAIVVTRIAPSTAGNEAVYLSGAVYGEVTKDVDADAYTYGSLSQQMTRFGFDAGLILPGEELLAVAPYRPVAQQDSFEIAYTMASNAFDGSAQSLQPFNVYVPLAPPPGEQFSMLTHYAPFTPERWRALSAEKTPVRSLGPDNSPRAVLLPDFEAKPEVMETKVNFAYAGAPFLLEDARTVASRINGARDAPVELAYCTAFKGYVVFESDCSWILESPDQKKRGNLLPAFPPVLLTDVDTLSHVQIAVGDEQVGSGPTLRESTRLFWDRFPVFYGDGMYTDGEFVHLERDEALEFLRKAQERHMALASHEYFFRSRYFVMGRPAEAR